MTDTADDGGSLVQLTLPSFEGPVGTLLRLVSQHRMAADELPVARVTEQFLSHLTASRELDLEVAGDLIAASARLMAMKSAQLLLEPIHDEDEDGFDERPADSTERAMYQSVMQDLRLMEARESVSPLTSSVTVERRVQPRSALALARVWSDMQRGTSALGRRVSVPAFLRLEVAVSRLIRRLRSGSRLLFGQLTGSCTRNDRVIHFLAVLELMRTGQISAWQPGLFDEITLEWVTDGRESPARAG
ncbi:MAG TPA: ScpA family protein [Chloroflexota bacterium]